MDIKDERIDGGKPFDWGKTSEDYARYRDIYPPLFYKKIADRGLCVNGQKVLDLGTGTGVLPRNMYSLGAKWTGADISAEQIAQAKALSAQSGMDIGFIVSGAEDIDFPDGSFDVVTACQCFFYFRHEIAVPKLHRILSDGGRLVILYMAWLPFEDSIAGGSEKVLLKYNPDWSGAGETRRPIGIPDIANDYFTLTDSEVYDVKVHFTRESWHGRMKACRGAGASLSPEELAKWETEHKAWLDKNAPGEFDILHYAAIAVLEKK